MPQKQRAKQDKPLRALRQAANLSAVGSEQQATAELNPATTAGVTTDKQADAENKLSDDTAVMLDNLCSLFGLSRFERQLLVLCVGVELDA